MQLTEYYAVILTNLSGTNLNSFAGLKGVGHDARSNEVEDKSDCFFVILSEVEGSYATMAKPPSTSR